MRAVIKILAAFSGLAGVALIVVAGAMLFIDLPAAATLQVRVLGLVLFAAAGAWCLFATVRFFRRPDAERAVAVGKPPGIALFLVIVACASGPADGSSIHPLVVPLAGLGTLAALYYFMLLPLARRAYPEDERVETEMANNEEERAATSAPSREAGVEPSNPATFALTPPFYRQMRRRAAATILLFAGIVLPTGIFLGGTETIDWSIAAIVGVGGLALLGGTMTATFRRQLKSLETLRIELDPLAIRRTQAGFPDFAIRYNEITKIVDLPDKGLLVVGRSRYDQLFLSRHLSDFDALRRRLETVHPFEAGRSSLRGSGLLALVIAGTVLCLVVAFRSTNPLLVTTAATALILGFAGSALALARCPHVDRRVRRSAWSLAIVVLVLAMRIWTVWSTAP